jgi:hypothetical protein
MNHSVSLWAFRTVAFRFLDPENLAALGLFSPFWPDSTGPALGFPASTFNLAASSFYPRTLSALIASDLPASSLRIRSSNRSYPDLSIRTLSRHVPLPCGFEMVSARAWNLRAACEPSSRSHL